METKNKKLLEKGNSNSNYQIQYYNVENNQVLIVLRLSVEDKLLKIIKSHTEEPFSMEKVWG